MNTYTDDFFQTLPPTAAYQTTADNSAELTLTFHLLPDTNENALQSTSNLNDTHPKKRQYLSAADLKQRFAVNDNTIQKMTAFARQAGLKEVSSEAETHEMAVTGTIAQFSQLFGISFHIYQDDNNNPFLAYHGRIQLPDELRAQITGIDGLNVGLQAGYIPSRRLKMMQIAADDSPVQHFIQQPKKLTDLAGEQEQQPQITGYSPQDLTALYHFPDNQGEGQTVGIIALGGTFNPSDLATFCTLFQLEKPDVQIVGTEPWQPPQSKLINNLEINMDVQLVAGIVPKAKIIVYYASSFPDGFRAVLNDTENAVSVISTSWANGESNVSQAEKAQSAMLLQQLGLRGITVLAASGDYGIYQVGSNNKVPGVNLPAAYDSVIACGGTDLFSNGGEQVWRENINASGGGFSIISPPPAYQYYALSNYFRQYPNYAKNACATPDLSVNASGVNYTTMIFNGKPFKAAGTSAATPLIAGLIARLNTALSYRVGNINSFLYQLIGSNAFSSNIPGSNGLPAAAGWDPCTGLGSPNGVNLLGLIKQTESYWE
ncbi:S8/S53 family peptidase [Pectobacterium sp. A535-S3-A17]|uniref:S53 family peptidase n=1 Tax=Pectobacterium quasiaquaticum TaxID=2774015 RepID=UPI0018760A76|nr:S53 family peptidase [Pectobacterium quasiaquaticum]MBE5212259.1 S8/S53 family peptidase [Pectobacterium quasiaquaticum]MBE5225935.1 S8/S53 family peptidase [Pectobacterium quasiaquaticum]